MADGKWIPGLKPDTPLRCAAERTLKLRLAAVRKLLPKAARQAHEDVEHIHRLRVSTRRARAALDLFADCLPRKLFKRIRRTLRRIRRSAGDARDCDVFLPRLHAQRENAAAHELPGLQWLTGYVSSVRARAQDELDEQFSQADEALREHLTDVEEEFRESRPESPVTLRAHAGPHLLQLVSKLEDQAEGDLSDATRLHAVRICGKRLRYATEVFAAAFSPELKRVLYPWVEQMQDHLGRINDHAVGVERLIDIRTKARLFEKPHWSGWRPGVDCMLAVERKQLALCKAEFAQFWQDWGKRGLGDRFRALVSG
jgi:CHAD domain-containing protein